MNQRSIKKYLPIICVLVVSLLLRFYKLGAVPHGMTWDEAAIGYNGHAVITTRRDEWLERLPIAFKSFGDYKAPLAIYLNGFATYVFGMTLWSVRLPFAIGGVLTVVVMYYLLQVVFRQHIHREYLAIAGASILAVSPWHLHFSRVGFESGIALLLLLFGMLCLFYSASIENKTNKQEIILSAATAASLVGSLYAYHSSKVVVPLLILAYIALFVRPSKKNVVAKKWLVFAFTVFVFFIVWPLIVSSIWGHGLERANATLLSNGLTFQNIGEICSNFFKHISLQFLVFGQTDTLRHGTGAWGVLYPTTLFLFLAGLVSPLFLKTSLRSYLKDQKQHLFFVLWIGIGLLPASLSSEVPHPNRALLALPAFIVLAVYGLDYLYTLLKQSPLNDSLSGSHGENNLLVKSFFGTLLAVHLLLVISYLNYYYSDYAKISAQEFKDGYLEAFTVAEQYERGWGVKPVDSILFTSDYGQPYIYALFVRETSPLWYQHGSLNKYQFADSVQVEDLDRDNTLVVASQSDEVPVELARHLVYGSDGQIKFKIYLTKDHE